MSNTPRPSVAELLESLLLPACGLAAILIGVVGLGRFLRLDEANSVIIASSSLGQLFEYLRNDNNLPFYYLLLQGWIRLAGISEWAVHLPSVVFYLLAIVTTSWLGWEASGTRYGARYSAFFYLVSLQAIHQAQKTRMYSLLGLLAGLSTLLFLRVWFRDKMSKRDWALYVLVNAVGAFVHVWYFFVLIGHAACALIFQPKKIWLWAGAMAAAVLPFLLLWARYLPHQAKIGAVDWMPRVRLSFFPGVFGEFYGGMRWGWTFLFGVMIICLFGKRGEDWQDRFPSRGVMATATIAIVCTIMPLLVSLVRPIYWPGRYTMIALPAFATALGCLVAVLGSPPLRVAFAYGVLLTVIVLHVRTRTEVFETSSNVFQEKESDKPATLELCEITHPGDTLVFTGLSRAGVEYYFRRLNCGRDLVLVSVPSDTARHLGWARQETPEELQAEAHVIVQQFTTENLEGRRLWVVLERGKTSDALTETLSRSLNPVGVDALRGSFFDEVRAFTPKTHTQPTSPVSLR